MIGMRTLFVNVIGKMLGVIVVSMVVLMASTDAFACVNCSKCTSCGSYLSGSAARIDCKTLRVTLCDYYGGNHNVTVTGWINNQHKQLASTSIAISQPTAGLCSEKSCASKDISISLRADGTASYLWVYASSPSGEAGYVFDPNNKMVDTGGNAVMSFKACRPPPTPTPTPTPTKTPTPTPTPTATPLLVQPIAECIDVQDSGTLIAHFGYQNTGGKEVVVPIGEQNFLSPGNEDRGQPTTFVAGRVTNSFLATFNNTTKLRWTVGERFAEASIATERCQGDTIECTDTDNKGPLSKLDNTARIQRNKVIQISNRIIRFSKGDAAAISSAEAFITRARALYLAQWKDIWSSFPQVTQSCVGEGCVNIDKSADIKAITTRSRRFVRLARASSSRLKKVTENRDRKMAESLLQDVKALDDRCIALTADLPRFESKCD
jgi:hypothetical protein